MNRTRNILSAALLCICLACDVTPDESLPRMHINPIGETDWFVGWSHVQRPLIDGVPVSSSLPSRIDGRDVRRLYDGRHYVTLPARSADPCATRRLIVLGDGRSAVDGLGPSAYWSGLLQEAIDQRPDYLINTGDLVKNGDNEEEWLNFLRQTPVFPPMIAVRGNHDRGEWFDRLQLNPSSVWWFKSGPALVVLVDSEMPSPEVPTLISEVDSILRNHDAQWTIVVMHRPIWSRGNHGSDERDWNHLWVPVFDRHGVDLVLSGHDHNYERFCRQVGIGAGRACDANGTAYIVTGGAATFTNPVPGVSRKVSEENARIDAEHSRVYSGAHHFVILDIGPQTMSIQTESTRTGNFLPRRRLDSALLRKAVPSDCR